MPVFSLPLPPFGGFPADDLDLIPQAFTRLA